MADFSSTDDLIRWLTSQPDAVARSVAARAALRMVPIALAGIAGVRVDTTTITNATFRAALFLRKIGSLDSKLASAWARDDLSEHAGSETTQYAIMAIRQSLKIILDDDDVIIHDVIESIKYAQLAAQNCARIKIPLNRPMAGRADVLGALAAERLWEAISFDCTWQEKPESLPEGMMELPLWPAYDSLPEPYSFAWNNFVPYSRNIQYWGNWISWYDSIVSGSQSEWDLPPTQDGEMAKRLIGADNEFWKRRDADPSYVNRTIGEWLNELSIEALFEEIRLKLANGKTPDVSSFAARQATENALAAIAVARSASQPGGNTVEHLGDLSLAPNPRAIIGGNNPPDAILDDRFESFEEAFIAGENDRVEATVEVRLAALEETIRQGDVAGLISQASWLHRLIQWLPEGFRAKFAETLGEKTAEELVAAIKSLGGSAKRTAKWAFHLYVTLPAVRDAIIEILQNASFR